MSNIKTVEEARKEASKIVSEDRANFGMRSCWNCNGAHEHLKGAEYVFTCFECGHWYYKGFDITEKDEQETV